MPAPNFIKAYIPKYEKEASADGRINGAYGPRLFSTFGLDQIEAVTKLLERKPHTRRAVIQLYSAIDLNTDEDVPCTIALQFFIRGGKLHMMASLRSNDVYLGLSHDIFCFTMLQEMFANRLGCDLGEYIHVVGSFHLYEPDKRSATRYMDEGHHRLAEMPSMPVGNPFEIIDKILEAERLIRTRIGDPAQIMSLLPPYWVDLLRLVQVRFAVSLEEIDIIRSVLTNSIYQIYIDDFRDRLSTKLKSTSNPGIGE